MAVFRQTLSQSLLLRSARQLITLRGPAGPRRGAALGELGIIEDGAILIRDGVIVQVGSTRRVENLKEVRGAAEIDLNGAIVMPGLVDPAIRLNPDPPVPMRRTKPASFYEESLSLMRSCLDYGTLTAQVRIGSSSQGARSDSAVLRQLTRIGNHPIGMTRVWRPPALPSPSFVPTYDYLSTATQFKKNNLADSLEIAAEWDDSFRERVWQAAYQSGLAVNLCWTGGSSVTLADYLMKFRPQAVLCSRELSDSECSVASQAASPFVFSTVGSVAKDHVGDTLKKLAAIGAPIALASGYDVSDLPVFNMQLAIAAAVLRHGLTTEQAISGATINAAHAAGRAAYIGSLEVGKVADLLVMSLPDYREIPARLGTNYVGLAIREGKISFNRVGWKVSQA
jgi:imidazolonepropionase